LTAVILIYNPEFIIVKCISYWSCSCEFNTREPNKYNAESARKRRVLKYLTHPV